MIDMNLYTFRSAEQHTAVVSQTIAELNPTAGYIVEHLEQHDSGEWFVAEYETLTTDTNKDA